MRRLVGTMLLFHACTGYGQTQTSENLLTATETSANIAFNAGAGTYQYSFQTGNVTAVGVLPQYDPLQILTLNWSFDALYNCNNSFGGYCGDPNGTEDEIEAFLAVGNAAGDTDVREVFSRRDFNQEWQTFTGTEVYDFGTAYEAVSLRIDGVDRGFWAGNYGPSVRNPSVVAIYTPINTNPVIVPDCSNPQNDSSCAGYGENVAVQESVVIAEPEPQPPTFADQATNAVFGDSPDDFLFLDQPDATGKPKVMKHVEPPPVYENTPQEKEMFGMPPERGMPRTQDAPLMQAEPRMEDAPAVQEMPRIKDKPPIFDEAEDLIKVKEKPVQVGELRGATSEEIMAEVVRVTKDPRPEPARVEKMPEPEPIVMRKETAPIEVVAETRAEPAAEAVREVVRPAVDAVGMALSMVSQQSSQGTSGFKRQQQSQETQQTAQSSSQSGGSNYWDSATKETQIAQGLVQQIQQQQSNNMVSVDLAPPSQEQFEDDFNDALATGQSVGQFLSSQPPDFSRFEIDEPTVQEQFVVQKATVALKTMSEAQVSKSMDQQLETLSDTGGFTDQSLTVVLISNNEDFNQYQDVSLSDRDEFYKSKQVYPKNAPRVDPFGVLRLGGSETFNDLVDIQWQR